MVTTEWITIKVPSGMKKFLVAVDSESELTRNALILYPYIVNQTISHGRAAEILGIRKPELIDLYDKLGYSYLDINMNDLNSELKAYRQIKENLFKPKSAEEIYSELAESRACYERGEYEDFDTALDDISKKYGL